MNFDPVLELIDATVIKGERRVLDGLTLDSTDVFNVPGAHGAITSLNGRRFYTTNISGGGADAIFCIDTRTNDVLAEPADTAYTVPHNVALTPSGRLLYVTHSGANNKVSVFRARPGESVAERVTVRFGKASVNQIVVLEAGKVAEHGSHEELLKAGGAYARFAEEQRIQEDMAALEDLDVESTRPEASP